MIGARVTPDGSDQPHRSNAILPRAYGSKEELLRTFCAGKRVLHLGAVGGVGESLQEKVAHGTDSVHAFLSDLSDCVGIDTDEEAIGALAEAGVFTNIVVADVTTVAREDIPLQAIDVIVAGDIIEHLSSPGAMLDNLRRLADAHTQLIVTTPNALGLPAYVRYVLGKPIEGSDHVVSFNVYTLRNLLTRHQWEPVTVSSCYQLRASAMTGAVLFRLGKWFFTTQPRFGGTLFVVAVPS